LYDPATDLWTATDRMNTNHYQRTATLLANGKVLVVGGEATASAELFDPATGLWTTTGAMSTKRSYQTATLLPSGKVLVAGGSFTSYPVNDALASAELYDPATGLWTATGAMRTERTIHTATLLASGKVLVAGGWNDSHWELSSAELYDPATETWTTTGAMRTETKLHTATFLSNGKVLVAGGSDGMNCLASTELYDPATGTWTTTGAMSTTRVSHTATLLPNGKVLVTGGWNGTNILSIVDLYDPATGTWTAIGALSTTRYYHTAALLPSGKVLLAGGMDDRDQYNICYLSSSELYDALPADYNRISVQVLGVGGVRLSYAGNGGAKYAIDRTFKLAPANWVPLVTNAAGSDGLLVFTNTPNSNTNNFWRIRSVP
ncbi:MAG: hypothetical protein NT154_48030, partial [Verrucomicrobia bacterium]|nr:hypothetical protein [Verrucomicrobiota bacterium]